MAFGRSASGPGGLSISTSSANSLFGSTAASTPPSTSLFGQTKPSNSLFGTPAASTAPGSSLFGGSTTSQAPASNLFGSSTSQPQTSSLFGASKPAQAQPSLFSNPSAPAAQPTSLFGNTTSQPQSTSLFGAPAATSQPQSTSLFGGSMAKPQQSSGFGSSLSIPQAQPPPLFGGTGGGSVFSSSTSQPSQPQQQQPPPGRSLLFGASTAPQPTTNTTTIPAVTVDVSNILPTTRFSDLHPDLQTSIANTQSYIDAQVSLCSQIDTFTPGHDEQVKQIPKDVTFLDGRVRTTTTALENDAAEIDAAHRQLRSDKSDAELSFAAVQALHLPAGYNSSSFSSSLTGRGSQSSKTLLEFFDQRLATMSSTLATYTGNMTEIEQHLRGVEARMVAEMQKLLMERGRKGDDLNGVDEQIRALAGVLGDFEAGIMGVAGKVGAAREGVQSLELGR